MSEKSGIVLSVLLLVTGWFAQLAAGRENYYFTRLKNDSGLPHHQISSLAFDHDGLLWIGTRNGLTRYDGYSFTTYYNRTDDPSSINHNFIRCIFVDKDNNVWIGSDKEICRYRRDTDDFERYDVGGDHITHISQTGNGSIVAAGSRVYLLTAGQKKFRSTQNPRDGYVVGLAVSPDNRIFVATNKSIAYYSAEMTMETMMDNSLYCDFLSGFDAIAPLYFDSRKRLWIGRDGHGVMYVDESTGASRIYPAEILSSGTIRTITEDAYGLIWLGTENGITIIDPATENITCLTQSFGNSRTLSDNAIYSIVPDSSNNIWIGSYFGGINLVLRNATMFGWIAPGYDGGSIRGKAVRRIIEPEKGELWLATEDGGINILTLKDKRVKHFDRIPGLGSNIHELFRDPHSGDLWIGTFRNGLFRYNSRTGTYKHYTAFNSGLKSNAIFSIVPYPGKPGSLYIATTKGLFIYDAQTDEFRSTIHPILDNDFIFTLHLDCNGNLWVGTVNNGLYYINTKSKEIKGWGSTDTSVNNGLKDPYITSIYEDCAGRVFVGTNNSGVCVIDSRTLKFIPFNNDSHIFGTICNIMEDNTGNIWMTTSSGLFKINPDDLSYVRFSPSDGLPENRFNFASALHASDDNIYCGTVNGLVSFDPNVKKRTYRKATVHLWNLILNNDTVSPRQKDSPLRRALDATDELRLDYASSRMLSIDYGIIDPVGTQNVRYQIFVEGLDKEWRDVGSQRRFTAMEIPYGSYIFNVRVLPAGNDWESAPVRSLTLKIDPPYYLSSMAWFIYILIAISLGYVIHRLFNLNLKKKQLKKMEQMEQKQKDELNRAKMEFFTSISHELKTPLSLILAPLKHLSSNQPMTEESSERLSTAIANTTRMVDLINELVTFNRVESDNLQLFLQKGNPLIKIETFTRYFRGQAQEKNITINVLTQDNGEEVWYSATYLELILSNLLSNAVKYTDRGGVIDVRASIVEGEDNNVFLQLEVKDTGIGIKPGELDNIFKKYYQTSRGYKASQSGWGIGLATVKRLVEIHKGKISVSSVVGEGSSFVVSINVTQEAFDQSSLLPNSTSLTEPLIHPFISNTLVSYPDSSAGNAPGTDKKKVSILIVEDNPELLRFLHDEFSRDYNTFTATNGVEALKVTSEYPIDIVVSDVMMPEMDGIELCERLKNDLSTSHIPVILLTAKSDEESTMTGYKSGAEAYVAKPFDPQILALRVKNILRARRAYIDSKIENPGVNEPIEELPPLNKFDNEFIARINQLTDDNMDNSHFSIADITRELGVSRSLLHIKMKTFFNSSMTDYIKQRRMSKACELMRQGNNVSETAYLTGFSDPNYFSKVFRKTYGMSPKDYISSLTS